MAILGTAAATVAAPIDYGDFTGTTVMYLDVTETATTPGDAEPLFVAPNLMGDTLDFDPKGFAASASSQSADTTGGKLSLTLMGAPGGNALVSISLSEGGDYSLLGMGTAATQISYAVSLASVTVLEVDGVLLSAPVALATASASGADSLGTGTDSMTPWSLSLSYDVGAALGVAGVPFAFGATKLEIVIDNLLTATSERGSMADIVKKDFTLHVATVPIPAPEPASLMWLCLAAVGLSGFGFGPSRRRERRSTD